MLLSRSSCCTTLSRRAWATVAGSAITLSAMLTSGANAQLHGGGVQKACDSNLCVGNNLRCIIAAVYLDGFNDVLMLTDAFDIVEANPVDVNTPVTIFAVIGNASCAGGGTALPCVMGAGGVDYTATGFPELDGTQLADGLVLFLSDDYIIDADDPDPLLDVGHIVFEDQCNISPQGCNPNPQDLQFGASTNIINPGINIEKVGTPDGPLCVGVESTVDYTFTVTNTGDVPLLNVVVDDSNPDCTPALQSGDTNANNQLDLTETWIYTCTVSLTPANTNPINNTATVTADAPQSTGTAQLPPVDTCSVEDSDTASVTPNQVVCTNITGPSEVCSGSTEEYCGPAGADTYAWVAEGQCTIDGSATGQCVDIAFTTTGRCDLTLTITDGGCSDDCELNVDVVECPVCKEITPVGPAQPDCGSTGNQLTADINNETPETVLVWSVTDGPCVIDAGQGTITITYSIPGDCSVEVCCTFELSVDDPTDNAPKSICEETVCCIPCTGGEGRTPGFWKQAHHFGHWPDQWCPHATCGCTPTQFCAVFNCAGAGAGCTSAVNAAYANKTLLQVLQQGGGGFKALGRHAVAGLLNSGVDPTILDYAFSTAEVIAMVNNAIATCQTQPAHGDLADNNELEGGSIGGQSFCTDLNLDGAVNNHDLGIILSNWGKPGAGDIDNNGVVGSGDLSILISNWGTY